MCQHPTFSLPIEGQAYMFKYNTTSGTCVDDVNNTVTLLTCVNNIAILAFSYVELPAEPNWVDSISSVFSQYDRLHPVMHQISTLPTIVQLPSTEYPTILNYTMCLNIIKPPRLHAIDKRLIPYKAKNDPEVAWQTQLQQIKCHTQHSKCKHTHMHTSTYSSSCRLLRPLLPSPKVH